MSRSTIDISIQTDNPSTPISIQITEVWNFGYAARDQAGLRRHIEETRAMGISVPETTPTLYGLTPDRATCATEIFVVGDETYGEVEIGLLHCGDEGWLVLPASDHTDALVERASVSRGKAITPDVIGTEAWRLAELEDHFDELELRSRTIGRDGSSKTVQAGSASVLLSPKSLLETAQRRLGRQLPVGALILSGTIDGEPPPGTSEWGISLYDPVEERELSHSYGVIAVDAEVTEPTSSTQEPIAP